MDSKRLDIALIIGSTRPNRFADVPADWIRDGAAERHDLRVDTLDLRDWDLPFLDEPLPPSMSGGVFTNPAAQRWRETIAKYDGFLATVAEYNHGPTAVLKNALDSAYTEWNHRPIAFIGYGGVGAARAVEQLRLVAIELRLAPIKQAVHIGVEPMVGVQRLGKSADDYPHLVQSRAAMFDELEWWARALKAARRSLHSTSAAGLPSRASVRT